MKIKKIQLKIQKEKTDNLLSLFNKLCGEADMEETILEDERKYLKNVLKTIDSTTVKNSKKIKENTNEIQKQKSYFSQHYYDIKKDGDEIAEVNIEIENLEHQNEILKKNNERLKKQKKHAYFGRFDFKEDGQKISQPFYIGLGGIQTPEQNNLVYDWRADICSLYYDDKFGKTSYKCGDGEISGQLNLKRQYKIENDNLQYYIDNKLVIDDDILMEQLSKNATSKMHEIVSTIQKEQNTLIRSDDFSNTIVQGVAGSGKTSIAMHRVSYLLYKFRGSLKNEDILILSPSELFSDYLSEVLPSLGEDKSFTITFAELAKRLLGMEFETREDMLEHVIGNGSQQDFENIAIKSSFEFLEDLKNFLNHDLCNFFMPKTLNFGEISFTKEEINNIFFEKMKNVAVYKRIDILAEHLVEKFHVGESVKPDLLKRAKKILYSKFLTTDLLKIYNIFLSRADLPEVEKIGAYDVAPIMLIKESLFGLHHHFDAKYVIIDEMQDYTPCHFYLFNKIWDCGKLILGDIYQSIDRTLPASYLTNLAKLTKSKIKYLNKSYRSTMQISLFSQKIINKHIANNVNRNGEEVSFIRTHDCAKKLEEIIKQYKAKHSDQSIAIICKTQQDIKELQKASPLIKKFKQLENGNSKEIITTPAQAKGVEFDCVVIPFANKNKYFTELDQNLLYVSSTRALHKLYFVCDKTPSRFLIKKETKNKLNLYS